MGGTPSYSEEAPTNIHGWFLHPQKD